MSYAMVQLRVQSGGLSHDGEGVSEHVEDFSSFVLLSSRDSRVTGHSFS